MADNPYDAADVAVELRRRLAGIGTKKLHKLLYLCQAHHLADFGEPLFGGSIAAWDMGPVVGGLGKQEQTKGAARAGRPLDQAALNTVGFVVSRYGRLTGRDLEILTHGQSPWIAARARGASTGDRSPKIIYRELIDFFRGDDGNDEDPVVRLEPAAVSSLLRDAQVRSATQPQPDNLARLASRLSALTGQPL